MASFFKHQPKFYKKDDKKANGDSDVTDNEEITPVSSGEDEFYCFCKEPDSGNMLGCENDNCPHEWYHPKCLGILEMPEKDEAWFCPDCRELKDIKEIIVKLESGGTVNGMTKVNLDGMKIEKPKIEKPKTKNDVKARKRAEGKGVAKASY